MESNKKIESDVQNKTKMRDDEQFNISFVKKVQEYECLYDYTRSDYKNIQIQDKAWQEISEEFNETSTNCKERWRNLRGCYTRHLKQQLTPGMRIRKPYYLAESMSFIHPFTKTRTHISTAGNEIELKAENIDTINSTLLSDTEAIENDIENSNNSTTTVHKIDESSYQIISKNDNHVIVASTTTPMVTVAAQTTPTVTIATQQKENILKRKLFDSSDAFGASTSTATFSKLQAIEPPFYEIKPISGQDIEADMFFLKSLLPDITLMNQTQKRRLRIQILSLIDNILGEA